MPISSGRRRRNGPCTIHSFASCRGYTAASRCHKSIKCGAPLAKLAALRCPTPSASEARNFRSSGASQSNARTSSLHVRLAMRLATEQFRACAYCRPQHAAQPLMASSFFSMAKTSARQCFNTLHRETCGHHFSSVVCRQRLVRGLQWSLSFFLISLRCVESFVSFRGRTQLFRTGTHTHTHLIYILELGYA